MKKTVKILSLILASIMVLSVLSACSKNGDEESSTKGNDSSSDETTSEPKQALKITENGKCNFTIVRSELANDNVKKAAIAVKNALNDFLGGKANIKLAEDFIYAGKSPDKYEILVGSTNRDESLKAMNNLKYQDFSLTIQGSKLAISAYTDKNLQKAVEYFTEFVKGCDGDVTFTDEDQHIENAEYKVEDITFDGRSLKGYTIVYPKYQNVFSKSSALNLQNKIAQASGLYLPLKDDESPETNKEILVGKTKRTSVDTDALGEYGYEIKADGDKLVIAANDDGFALVKTIDMITDFENNPDIKLGKGKAVPSKDPILTSMCFADVHNNFSMLEPPYKMRTNVNDMIDEILKTEGKVDIAIIGGDYMSDYPGWITSGNLPYDFYLGFKKLTIETFDRITKDGKVLYVAGNHDYAQGEVYNPAYNNMIHNKLPEIHPEYNDYIKGPLQKGPGKGGTYNSFDFYFDGPMDKTLGVLDEDEMFYIEGKHTGEKYLLCWHYIVNGIHFVSLAPDPDLLWEVQAYGFNKDSLVWLKNKLNEIDPYGTELIFFVSHYAIAQRDSRADVNDPGIDSEINRSLQPILKGHKNLFYLFGHWHVKESSYHSDYTVKNVFHYNGNGTILNIKGNETDSTQVFKNYSQRDFHAVWMGGFRYDYSAGLFGNDTVKGFGGNWHPQYWGPTATPKFAQGLYFEVYEDRVVFTMKNVGDYPDFCTKDKVEPYTVYLYK